ncbi:MAG: fluoride efflux transporter CrcB [Anaerolineales bacterium]|nr:fluoride efflux transporter CrcB [Anaerolineales bacterium]
MNDYLLIALGGGLGACARYWLSGWAAQKFGPDFPYGTLLINVSGSFVLGLFLTAAAGRLHLDPRWRLPVAVGFLGAYTTFSTYTYDSVALLLAGRWPAAVGNLLGNNLLGLAGAALGIALGHRV